MRSDRYEHDEAPLRRERKAAPLSLSMIIKLQRIWCCSSPMLGRRLSNRLQKKGGHTEGREGTGDSEGTGDRGDTDRGATFV